MRALVTGSAGFIGSHVVRVLLDAGHEVRALHLPSDDLRNLRGLEVERIAADVTDPAAVARAVAGCDWVFHLAAVYALWARDPELMQRVNVDGTRHVLEAARRAGVARVVHTSSLARFAGQGRGRSGTEESAFALGVTGDVYSRTKHDSHELAVAAAAAGQDVVIVAPTGPLGPGDVGPTPTGRILLAAASLPLLASPETITNMADVRDMARGHLLAAERGKSGESYLLGHRNLSVRELAHLAAEVLGQEQAFVEVPFAAAELLGRASLFVTEHLTARPPLITPAAVAISRLGLSVDCTKAVRELGLPQTPIEHALRDAFTWFEREGYVKLKRPARRIPTPPVASASVSSSSLADPRRVDTLVIGAGISGVGVAIRLASEGFHDFVLLEKASSLGGTWRDNTYPGAACDVPSALYSYSFAPRPDWTEVFAGQKEILAYVEDTAKRFAVLQKIRFGTEVHEARWDEPALEWIVETSAGTYRARTLVSCAGYLHEPILPSIPGLDAFPGPVFHSSRWRHDVALAGKRVAVVGSGASAVQLVPKLQPEVASLHVFQRTPHWVLPKPNHGIPALETAFFRLPYTLAAWRASLYGLFEALGQGFQKPRLMEKFQAIAEGHLSRQVKDAALREVLTPRYLLGCKRVLLSNDYYPALCQPNVRVHPTELLSVEGASVRGKGEAAFEVDAIVLATGFHVSDPPIATRIRGAAGKTLAEQWAGSPRAYRGTTVHGFPSFFLVLGPNLGIGHNSAFLVIEAQLDYLLDALRHRAAYGVKRSEVREVVEAAYNERIQRGLATTVWNTGGCQSYYLDKNGRNSICYPGSTIAMRRMLARFDRESYEERLVRGA